MKTFNDRTLCLFLIVPISLFTACTSPYYFIVGSNVASDFQFKNNKHVAAFRINNSGCYSLMLHSKEGVTSDGIIIETYYRDSRIVYGDTLIHSMIFYGGQEKIKKGLRLEFFCCKSGDVVQFAISGVSEDFFKNKKLKFKRHNRDGVLGLDIPIVYIQPTAKPYTELDEESQKRRLQLIEEKEKTSELIKSLNMPNPPKISVTFRDKHIDTSVNETSLEDYIKSAVVKALKIKYYEK